MLIEGAFAISCWLVEDELSDGGGCIVAADERNCNSGAVWHRWTKELTPSVTPELLLLSPDLIVLLASPPVALIDVMVCIVEAGEVVLRVGEGEGEKSLGLIHVVWGVRCKGRRVLIVFGRPVQMRVERMGVTPKRGVTAERAQPTHCMGVI
eukprot:CAMPEP_0185764342 /NCGR_PEP_ID=MMETSP1174-20130828/23277_1 /TAXON_ID=35687 /ORGANISM="Dictyocha speculum, Strain CCMP1381" /LENGTH=151 /DNA_ID=CAMNT_0028446833 /DNA_START=198 /DNA_END=652 /DNA_ORIENTATION=-